MTKPTSLLLAVLIFLVGFLPGPQTFAVKERGGECKSSGVTCDVAENLGSVLLSDADFQKYLNYYLEPLANDLPQFVADLRSINHSYWYLEPKPLDAVNCGLDESGVALKTRPVACQTVVKGGAPDVRISAQIWAKSSTAARAQIVLHEALRTIQQSHQGYAPEGIRRIFRVIVANDPDLTHYVLDVRVTIELSGYGTYLTANETAALLEKTKNELTSLCGLDLADYNQKIFVLYHSIDDKFTIGTMAETLLGEQYILFEAYNNQNWVCTNFEDFFSNKIKQWRAVPIQ